MASVIVGTMADLRAQSVTALQNADRIEMLGYYAANDQGGGEFVWNATDSRSDDGGVIIKPTAVSGNGRLNRIVGGISDPVLHSGWYGIKADNSTDNGAPLQALINAAVSLGINAIYLDPCPNGSINFSSTLTVAPGLVIRGAGKDVTKLNCTTTNNTTFAFYYQAPNGNGFLPAPKFYDFSITCRSFLQLNSVAGGFTDDITTQNPLYQPHVMRCGIYNSNNNVTTTVGILACKCAEMIIQDNFFGSFGIAVDMEGSENCRIRDNRMVAASVEFVLATSHGTFGNGLIVEGNFMGEILGGANAAIVSSYRSITIRDNWLEGVEALNGVTTNTTAFWLQASTSAVAIIEDNWVGYNNGSLTSGWVKVDDTSNFTTSQGYMLIRATGNKGSTVSGMGGIANFNNNTGISYFSGNGGARRHIVHSSNTDFVGDVAWPFNSVTSLDAGSLPPGVLARFSPNLDGLGATAFGQTVLCYDGGFILSSLGSANYLEFFNQDAISGIDTGDLWVRASGYQGAIYGAILDASYTLSSWASGLTYSTPTWIKLASNIANAQGCRVYAVNATVKLWEAAICKHTFPTS